MAPAALRVFESVGEDEDIFKLDHGRWRCMSELYYAIITRI